VQYSYASVLPCPPQAALKTLGKPHFEPSIFEGSAQQSGADEAADLEGEK